MSFREQITAFAKKVDGRNRRLMVGIVNEVERSIKFGSEITGAPGQPVDTGNLLNSWSTFWETPGIAASIITNCIYAPDIEDGTRNGRAMTLRSQVGGFHSVKLTRVAFPRIIATVREQL